MIQLNTSQLRIIIKSNIHFMGRKTHEEVLTQMKKSDIFILPSVNETFGQVYLEAMGCGCITIGTRNDGIDGIIKDGKNGFLTTPNIMDIKKVLNRINNMPQKHCDIILRNCYNTVKMYNSCDCANNYINNIVNVLCK